MTSLLVILLTVLAAYGVYIAARTARSAQPSDWFEGGQPSLPGWAVMLAFGGISVASYGLADHFVLTSTFGLQASHIGLGLLLAALTMLLFLKRIWLAARISGWTNPGEAIGAYYQSITLRIVMMVLAALFGLPLSASLLSGTGNLIADISGGVIPRVTAIWVEAFFLFLPAVIGGWRATIFIVALQSALVGVLIITVSGFAETVLASPGFLHAGIPVAKGILADQIPGVVQYSAGIGKGQVAGGLFTSIGIASTALVFVGAVTSPAFLYLGMGSKSGSAFARGGVWIISGLAASILIVVAPFLAARMGHGIAPLAAELGAVDLFMGAGLALVFIVSGQLAVSFFTTTGAILLTRELIGTYVLPAMTRGKRRLAARVGIAIAYLLAAALAAFAPLTSAILASLALPLAAQLLPALLGFAFAPWISRSAVITGLIFGTLMVFFTEPPGLVLVEGLFVHLPWGRWPLTIHSVAWGLSFNFAAVLLVSIFTRRGEERNQRDRLHGEFGARWQVDFGSRNAQGALWSLTLIWAFLAIGPGAILGNTFFSQPIFTTGPAALGVPSLWVWQLLFWLLGVPLVWWLAYRSRLGFTTEAGLRQMSADPPERRVAPAWIAAGLARVTER
jgi:Na+/proline symporter